MKFKVTIPKPKEEEPSPHDPYLQNLDSQIEKYTDLLLLLGTENPELVDFLLEKRGELEKQREIHLTGGVIIDPWGPSWGTSTTTTQTGIYTWNIPAGVSLVPTVMGSSWPSTIPPQSSTTTVAKTQLPYTQYLVQSGLIQAHSNKPKKTRRKSRWGTK